MFRITFNGLTFGGFPPMMILPQRKFLRKGFWAKFFRFYAQKIREIAFSFFASPFPGTTTSVPPRGEFDFLFFLFLESAGICRHSSLLAVSEREGNFFSKMGPAYRKHCNFRENQYNRPDRSRRRSRLEQKALFGTESHCFSRFFRV